MLFHLYSLGPVLTFLFPFLFLLFRSSFLSSFFSLWNAEQAVTILNTSCNDVIVMSSIIQFVPNYILFLFLIFFI